MSGITIGIRGKDYIQWAFVGKVVVLYIMLHIIRFVLLIIFLPLMNCFGYPMTWKHCALMTWGALRGALGLFLSLILVENKLIKEEMSNLILFYSSAIAILTLVINGTTTGAIVTRLGLSKETPTSKKFMYMLVQRVKAHSIQRQ